MALLEVRGLTKYFGGLAAVSELDFDVNQGEILGLIGSNGAGKTTAFNLISGFYRPNKGKIIFKGHSITGLRPYKIAALGVVRTFQQTALLNDQTVSQNIAMGLHLDQKTGFFASLFNTHSARRERERIQQRTTEILEFMGLAEVKDELATNLPHGFQRLLGVSMALATNPELILLDEPVTGMNAEETMTMMSLVRDIRQQGVTVLLVEHDMSAVMNTCDRIVVLSFGRKIADDVPERIRENNEVIESYLGSEEK